ncbi:MAG: hypothetical protein OXR73_07810 [Myxococcales bacterium]|nr:hypothetical protein [Myxococcales bacterium]
MSRCSWIWFVCWSVLGVGVSGAALADAGVPVVSLHGVRFELPADLKPVPAAAASQRNLSKAFIDGRGVQVLLLEPAPPDPTKAAQKLAFSVEDYARGFANSVQDKLGQGTLTDIEPLAHDPERGAVRARFTFNGPSPVASFLALPDEHPAWAPLRRPNVDTRQVRCLFRALLGEATTATEPELRAHVGAAASRCGRSTAEVETFAGALPASLFAPQRASLETISVFTRSAAVHMLVMAPEAAQAAAEFSTQLIWERFTVGAGTRPEVSISAVLRGTGMFDTGHLLGVAMGAALAVFVFGGLLGLLLARLSQLTAERAVLGVLVGIAALMLLGMVAGQLSWPAGVQFVAFTATGVLNRRRLTQWVAERADTDDDGGTGAPPKGPLACTQGLSTLEYGLLFVVVAAGGLLLWANLSERTAEHVQTSTAEMMAAMDGAMTRGRTGTASPPGIQGSSPSGFHSSDAPMPSDGQQHSHNAATAPPSGGQAHPAAATASTSHATGGVPLTAQTPLTTSYGAGETEESWWQSTKDYVRDTPPAQFIAGLVAGGIDGTTILTGFVESPEGSGTLFQVGRVAGEFRHGRPADVRRPGHHHRRPGIDGQGHARHRRQRRPRRPHRRSRNPRRRRRRHPRRRHVAQRRLPRRPSRRPRLEPHDGRRG